MLAWLRGKITEAIVPALSRHVAQAVGTWLMATGYFTGQESQVRGWVTAAIGALISIAAAALAGKDTTPAAIVTKAAKLPEVKRIVVNDIELAQKTPTEVVYGQDMSIQ